MLHDDSPPSPRPRIHRARYLAIAGALGGVALFVGLSLILIVHGSPLGHDESAYSLRARHFIEGVEPAFYWQAYRAPGLPVVLQLAWLGPATEPFLRLITALFGIPLLVSAWFISFRLFGTKAATLTIVGLALTPTVLNAATQVWPDVPGAAVGLTSIAVYLYSIDRDRASAWMLAVPVLAFLATMLRFGAPIPIAIGLIGITLWRYEVALASKALVLITATLTVAAGYVILYLPMITEWAQVGDPISPVVANLSLMARNDLPWTQAFINYARFTQLLIGGIASLVLVVGLITALIGAIRRTDGHLEIWVVVAIGIATFAALSLVLHGEPRYLSPALPWFWIASGYGLAALLPKTGRALGVTLVIVVLVATGADSLERANLTNETNRGRYTQVKALGNEIDAATTDNACGVISGAVPQIGWYSHCPTMGYDTDKVIIDSPHFGDGPTSLVFILGGKRQPEDEVLDAYRATVTGPVATAGDPAEGVGQYGEIWVVTGSTG